ncbi:hypothetical protein GLAREA_06731 [Glarea lozoyensis ATCC 20868]|uniref:Uncharacterized protein n=2 Tax=Glarea lozoyensis TaxID=101852 RepID=S3E5S0_GLAL2|nr:uncharacterized protein GLAREA_06731 [Glarea lozoyensis ATCC 20868]EHK99380.1 hypothetical protein M7I_4676 [Glarea lozoyensis 74030]EPE33718.1 hypothetical protein GLAREA_06731 [Glarea lozoyensis ATCC 20868]
MPYKQPSSSLHLRGGGKDDEEVNTWGDLEQELAWLDSQFDAIEKEEGERKRQKKTQEEDIQDTRSEVEMRMLQLQDKIKLAKDDEKCARELSEKDVDGVQDNEGRTGKEKEVYETRQRDVNFHEARVKG